MLGYRANGTSICPLWLTHLRIKGLMRAVAQIAQSVEQGIENPRVGGSIPSLGTNNSSLVQSVERRTVNPYVAGSSPAGGAKFEEPAHRAGFFYAFQLPLQAANSRVAPQAALNSKSPVCSTPSGFTPFSFFRRRIHDGFTESTSPCSSTDPCAHRQASHLCVSLPLSSTFASIINSSKRPSLSRFMSMLTRGCAGDRMPGSQGGDRQQGLGSV